MVMPDRPTPPVSPAQQGMAIYLRTPGKVPVWVTHIARTVKITNCGQRIVPQLAAIDLPSDPTIKCRQCYPN